MSYESSPEIVTYDIDRTGRKYLSELGRVTGIQYNCKLNGGSDQLSCVIAVPKDFRSNAIDPGRYVEVLVGTSVVWSGTLHEPTPTPDGAGWTVAADGIGNWGVNFLSLNTTIGASTATIVNAAIARGLKWINAGLGYNGIPIDTNAETIADVMNNAATFNNVYWTVDSITSNVAFVAELTTANMLITVNAPVGRTLAGYANSIYGYYQISADSTSSGSGTTTPATYGTVNVQSDVSQAKHGVLEAYVDLTGPGVMSSGTATTYCQAILNKYSYHSNYNDAITVSQGQLMNIGGVPIDLATISVAGMKVRLLDFPGSYGGETTNSTLMTTEITIADYQYDHDSQTAILTPLLASKADLSSLLSSIIPPSFGG
jgi:hypothetical protein